jgi:hypothetical protein
MPPVNRAQPCPRTAPGSEPRVAGKLPFLPYRYKCLGHCATGNLRRIEILVHSTQATGHRKAITNQENVRVSGPKASSGIAASTTHFTSRTTRRVPAYRPAQ